MAISLIEAEYYAFFSAACEVLWIREFLKKIRHAQDGPITIYKNNNAYLKMALNTANQNAARIKYIRRYQNYIRQEIEDARVALKWVPGKKQMANSLTKPLKK